MSKIQWSIRPFADTVENKQGLPRVHGIPFHKLNVAFLDSLANNCSELPPFWKVNRNPHAALDVRNATHSMA